MDEQQIMLNFQEIIEGFKLHIDKVGVYDNETVKEALCEDLQQLTYVVAEIKARLESNGP
ncbi:hypothetical protein HPY27_01715 [Brevibacillus sp. HB1.1]|uniref:hypothetical protein n=1 Tax=Brevibacillus sp. HB1.1 TaxID=2738808 RepID=UPI001576044A|nr:hypothetical protein [Brevibacillus sp. HB1.1]NTU28877.1 hypothetical protein [Brevibacillus sp. HB1.1]